MNLRRWTTVLAIGVHCVWAAPIPRHLLKMEGALTESSTRAPREIGDQFTAVGSPGTELEFAL